MKLIHALNAALWCANAVVWFGYAHSLLMAVASLLAMALSIYMWRLEP